MKVRASNLMIGTLTLALIAGSLGVSSLVCLQNNGSDGEFETTANLMGPFWREGSPPEENGASIVRSPTAGYPIFVTGTVVDLDGKKQKIKRFVLTSG